MAHPIKANSKAIAVAEKPVNLRMQTRNLAIAQVESHTLGRAEATRRQDLQVQILLQHM